MQQSLAEEKRSSSSSRPWSSSHKQTLLSLQQRSSTDSSASTRSKNEATISRQRRSSKGSRPSSTGRTSTPRTTGTPQRARRGKQSDGEASQSRQSQDFPFAIDDTHQPFILEQPARRSGGDLWNSARGKKAGLRIIAGKTRVSDLISTLRDKLSDVQGMLSELDQQKGMEEVLGEAPQNLPRFDLEEIGLGEKKISLHPKNEALFLGSRFKFCYNPIDEHERYLPSIGVRAVKSYRGVLCEMLGDPADREQKSIWQRRLRIESATEASTSELGPPTFHGISPDGSFRQKSSHHGPHSLRQEHAAVRERTFEREVKRLTALRSLAQNSKRNDVR